jgi:type I restriction enzyme R subunit
MKGRGVRVISADDLRGVTPDAVVKDRYVIVDAVGVCEQDLTDSRPMEKRPSVSFEKLLQAVALGNTEPDVLSSVAARIARMERQLPPADQQAIADAADGLTLKDLAGKLVQALDPDAALARAQATHSTTEPTQEQIQAAARALAQEAVKPLRDPKLRDLLVFLKKKNEQTVDTVSQDQVLEAGFSVDATGRAKGLVQSFEQFIKDHQDEITALQVLYSTPYRARLRYEDIKALAEAIQEPPRLWRVDRIWQAYAALEKSRVRGASAPHILTDLVSLVRFALRQRDELVPYPDLVEANFQRWLDEQAKAGTAFTDDQLKWLRMIKDHIAGSLSIETQDFDYSPFAQEGGLGKAYQLFGEKLEPILQQLNEGLVA